MSRAAIIGAGVIGGGWAARFLLNGWDVAVFDPSPEARERLTRVLDRARYTLPMLYDRALPPEGRLTFAGSPGAAVDGADYIQESVPERLETKHAVYARIAEANADAPLGSSTSGFKPSDLGTDLATAHRLFVAHPFNPVYLLPLVELVPGPADPGVIARAEKTLASIGLAPLTIGAEIDAHIADRLLEAVWREALWLVHDGLATTREIDESIRLGFGLRWAQMGLFETYRIAGGAGGMAHFVEQFGPALKWPWSKLTDVPEMTPDFAARIGAQSDAQSGALSIDELEALRDRNLVALLRALKREGSGAGKVVADHEAGLARPADPRVTVRRTVPADWTDYNGHMNESRYGQVFSDAADAVLEAAGVDAAYVTAGQSYFTTETKTRFLAETGAGEAIRCDTRIDLAEGRKLRLLHEMRRERDGEVLATCEQFLLHVSLATRRSCPPDPKVLARLGEMKDRQ